MGFIVEPLGYSPPIARLNKGFAGSSRSLSKSSWLIPSSNKLESKDGKLTKETMPPSLGSIKTTAPESIHEDARCAFKISKVRACTAEFIFKVKFCPLTGSDTASWLETPPFLFIFFLFVPQTPPKGSSYKTLNP